MDTLVLENKLVKVAEVTLKPWVVVVDGISSTCISSTSIVRPKAAQLLQ
jgi:hypothetical protein